MKKFPVWSVVASVLGIVAGVFVLYIGARPFSVIKMEPMRQEDTIVYGAMACLGVAFISTGAEKIGGMLGNAICDSIAESLARKRKAKERAAMFTQSIEIPVFRPVQAMQFDHLVQASPVEQMLPEAAVDSFHLKPSV